jgi:hypothetical protein
LALVVACEISGTLGESIDPSAGASADPTQPREVGVQVPSFPCTLDGESAWLPLRSPECKHITVVAFTTDAAGDQAAAIRRLGAIASADEYTLILSMHCVMHQIHLTIGRQLKRSLQGKYVNQLAVIVNLWRSSSNPTKIRLAFRDNFDDSLATHVASSPPPAPIRGRWGAVDDCERHVLKATRQQLLTARHSQDCCPAPAVLDGRDNSVGVACPGGNMAWLSPSCHGRADWMGQRD